jgi:hypothetical protein
MRKAKNAGDDATAFDSLIDKMKSDIDAAERDEDPAGAGHAAHLKSIIEAALREVGGASDLVAESVHEGAETIRTQIKAHPAAAISSAFAAGYFIGRTIAGKVKK